MCAITAVTKKFKSIINKKKKHDKIVSSGKDTLNAIEVLILVNNLLRKIPSFFQRRKTQRCLE